MSIRLSALLLLVSIMGLYACKKNNDAPTVTTKVGLAFINASPDTVNVYLNGTRENNNSNLFPLTSTVYYPVPAGQQTFQIKKPFNPVNNTIQTLFSKTLQGDTSKYHSLFFTDETAANAFEIIDSLDRIPSFTEDTCVIRFVNASQISSGLDISVGGVIKFKNIPFKTATPFIFVNTTIGQNAISFNTAIKIFSTGTTTPLAIDSISLGANNVYTFYAKGKTGGTGTAAVALNAMVNTQIVLQ